MTDTRQPGYRVREGHLWFAVNAANLNDIEMHYELMCDPSQREEVYEDTIRSGTTVDCDSPFGWFRGEIKLDSAEEYYIVPIEWCNGLNLGDLRGDTLEYHEPNPGEHGTWRVTNWFMHSGTQPLPPRIDNKVSGPAKVAPVVVKKQSPLEQAMAEGYMPLCKDSPTGFIRPKTRSATQLIAYFQCLLTKDTDLAINEIDQLTLDPYGFFHRDWPDYQAVPAEQLARVG